MMFAPILLTLTLNAVSSYDFAVTVWAPYFSSFTVIVVFTIIGLLLTSFAGILSPVFIICGLFQMSLLNDLTLLVEDWTLKLDNKKYKANNVYINHNANAQERTTQAGNNLCLGKHLKLGLEIHDIILKVNKTLAPIMFIHQSANFVLAISALFMTTSFIFGKLTLSFVIFSLSFSGVELGCLYYFFCLCNAGEQLENMRKKATKAIDEIVLTRPKVSRDLLLILSNRFSKKNMIKPFGFFALNNANFINSFTIGYTYAIVLMQLKMAE